MYDNVSGFPVRSGQTKCIIKHEICRECINKTNVILTSAPFLGIVNGFFLILLLLLLLPRALTNEPAQQQ